VICYLIRSPDRTGCIGGTRTILPFLIWNPPPSLLRPGEVIAEEAPGARRGNFLAYVLAGANESHFHKGQAEAGWGATAARQRSARLAAATWELVVIFNLPEFGDVLSTSARLSRHPGKTLPELLHLGFRSPSFWRSTGIEGTSRACHGEGTLA
jgi:hypothetical protein